jgi:hypothetical protein
LKEWVPLGREIVNENRDDIIFYMTIPLRELQGTIRRLKGHEGAGARRGWQDTGATHAGEMLARYWRDGNSKSQRPGRRLGKMRNAECGARSEERGGFGYGGAVECGRGISDFKFEISD